MTKLIDTTSPTYQRRLVREIREAMQHGVYYAHRRVYAVRFTAGGIYAEWGAGQGEASCDVNAFTDGYGRQIVASREGR